MQIRKYEESESSVGISVSCCAVSIHYMDAVLMIVLVHLPEYPVTKGQAGAPFLTAIHTCERT